MILDTKFPIDPRVSNEASALIKKGHEVYLFCLSYKKKFIKEETINYIKVRRYYCSSITYKLSALAYSFPFYRLLMKKKISHFLKKNRIFLMQLNRFMWEDIEKGVFRKNRRIRTVLKFENVIGSNNKADAKIAGITPAEFILRGRCEESPPYILLPTCLLG